MFLFLSPMLWIGCGGDGGGGGGTGTGTESLSSSTSNLSGSYSIDPNDNTNPDPSSDNSDNIGDILVIMDPPPGGTAGAGGGSSNGDNGDGTNNGPPWTVDIKKPQAWINGPDKMALNKTALFSATVLNMMDPLTFAWQGVSPFGGFISFNPANARVTDVVAYLKEGFYTLKVEVADKNRKNISAEKIIQITAKPAVSIEGPSEFFKNEATGFKATALNMKAPSSIQWASESTHIVFSNPKSLETDVTADEEGTYTLKIDVEDQDGKVAFNEITVQVNAKPEVSIKGPGEFAPNVATSFLAEAQHMKEPFVFKWKELNNNTDISFTPDNARETNVGAPEGTYTLTVDVTDVDGKTASAQAAVQVKANPIQNHLPQIQNLVIPYTMAMNTESSISFNALDEDHDSLYYEIKSVDTGGTQRPMGVWESDKGYSIGQAVNSITVEHTFTFSQERRYGSFVIVVRDSHGAQAHSRAFYLNVDSGQNQGHILYPSGGTMACEKANLGSETTPADYGSWASYNNQEASTGRIPGYTNLIIFDKPVYREIGKKKHPTDGHLIRIISEVVPKTGSTRGYHFLSIPPHFEASRETGSNYSLSSRQSRDGRIIRFPTNVSSEDHYEFETVIKEIDDRLGTNTIIARYPTGPMHFNALANHYTCSEQQQQWSVSVCTGGTDFFGNCKQWSPSTLLHEWCEKAEFTCELPNNLDVIYISHKDEGNLTQRDLMRSSSSQVAYFDVITEGPELGDNFHKHVTLFESNNPNNKREIELGSSAEFSVEISFFKPSTQYTLKVDEAFLEHATKVTHIRNVVNFGNNERHYNAFPLYDWSDGNRKTISLAAPYSITFTTAPADEFYNAEQ